MPEIEPDTRGDRRCRLFRSLAPDPTSHTTHPPGSGSGPGRWSYHLESTKAPAPCPPPPRPAQQSTVWHSPKGAEIQWRLSQGSRTGSRSRSTRRQRSRASPRPGPSITYLYCRDTNYLGREVPRVASGHASPAHPKQANARKPRGGASVSPPSPRATRIRKVRLERAETSSPPTD